MIASANLGSLVFDFEVDREERSSTRGRDRPGAGPLARPESQLAADKEKLKYFSAPAGAFAAKLLRDVRYFLNEECDPDVILLATKLSAVGYNVNVRTALGGGPSCFRNLRHEFLAVRGRGDYEGVEFIVEPRFREAFSIPHPTAEYAELLAAAPDVFVGPSARLVPIVQTLCSLMAASFEAQGLTLPPWRRTQSMLSKWLPNRSRDTSFARASAPPHEDPDHRLAPMHMPGTRPTVAAPQPLPPAPPAAAGTAAPTAAYHHDHSPFLRISDPLLAGTQPPTPPSSTAAPAAAARQPAHGGAVVGSYSRRSSSVRRDDSDYGHALGLPGGFIPFGGAGGCSSDTEGPSPPAPGVYARAPAPFLLPLPEATQGPAEGAGAGGGAAASASARRPAGHGSLLASRLLHQQLHGGGGGAGGPSAAPPAIQTRPPSHWSEAPIHTVRMGFNVARAHQQQQIPATGAQSEADGEAEAAQGQCGGRFPGRQQAFGSPAQEMESEWEGSRPELELLPERPALAGR
ncbi:hypothetical protein GPECTOR_16g563 [Gonium pectorale]|uniref:Uncharacterized protein n=1 Tax=Gonium pectorale TaxID=33097 RepID=A0A150GM41_GONPE|nr:hypothetical protein GPECTOR_16g563 [Gonium pectorale]|eukprot:KXZ50390.1 hypothetical protein GPECTOR_16g563 [Gonium pectorale]